ncbi:hypothetical protein KY330_05800 [Candidatus Woesearchaeota archaeon]|nr:hypothetical protein [Candidatus Woesearchaeota archaeon]
MNLLLNPFGKGKSPEKEEKIKIEHPDLEEAVEIYMDAYRKGHLNIPSTPVLKPRDINLILHHLRTITDDNAILGFYIGKLVEVSYLGGNNDFELDVVDNRIEDFCKYLRYNPTDEGRLRITVNGDIRWSGFTCCSYVDLVVNGNENGNFSCSHLKHCTVEIKGDVHTRFGAHCEDSKFVVDGDAEMHFGHASKRCEYLVKGDVVDGFAARSEDCKYTFHGDVDCVTGILAKNGFPKNCKFYLKDEQAHGLLKAIIGHANKVVLL